MANILKALREKHTRKMLPVDQFGYVNYETLIKTLCSAYDTSDRLHVIEAVAHFPKDYVLKEGKLATSEWEALWTPNEREGARKPYIQRHYMSISKIAETIVRPRCFHDHVLTESLMASVLRYNNRKDDSEKVWQGCVLPPKEILAELCNEEIACNYETARGMIDQFSAQKKYRGIPYPQEYNDNLMHASDTPQELGVKRELWLKSVDKFYRVHGQRLSYDELVRETDARVNKDFIFKDGRFSHRNVHSALSILKSEISELMEQGRIRMFTGGPGTGKTYNAVQEAACKCTLWSLSNTVAFNGASRVRKQGKECVPMSFQKVRYLKNLGALSSIDATDVLIDEMSQMGIQDADILIDAILFVKNTNGRLIMMGDIHQIPSFLSRGSLLYSIMEEFPGIYKELTVNHRVEENSRIIADRTVRFSNSGNTSEFSDFMTRRLDRSLFSTLDPETVFITGANTQTAAINSFILNNAIPGLGLELNGDEPCDQLRKQGMDDARVKLYEFMRERSLEFIGVDTEALPELKIMRNERYICKAVDGMRVFVQSRVEPNKNASLNLNTFLKFMTPAYAINVNKAQGLEWDNVIITMGDVFKKDAGIKTNYLLRSSFEHLYVGVTRAKKSLSIFIGDLNNITLWPVKKFNLFKEIL